MRWHASQAVSIIVAIALSGALVSGMVALTESAPAVPQGGTLVFATNIRADFPANPVMVSYRPGIWMFDSLLELDARTGRPAPSLAQSWTVSDDGKVYTFKLRQDVKWHDGVQFTADDVVFTFNTWVNDPLSIFRNDFVFGKDQAGRGQRVQVVKINRFTVLFRLPEARNSFLENLTGWHLIVPKHLLDGWEMAKAPFNEKPVGTGVLVFDELRPRQFARFKMNKDYWRGRPNLDGFVWQVLPEDAAGVPGLANGEIDVIKNVTSVGMELLIAQISGVTIYSVLGNFTSALYLNPTFEPFKDRRVREAIAYSVDRPALVKGVLGADVPVANQTLNRRHWGYNPKARTFRYDVERAKALLREAGWTDTNADGIVDKDGRPLAFTVLTQLFFAQIPEVMQDYLKAVGIRMSIRVLDYAVRQVLIDKGDWQATVAWDGGGVPTQGLKFNWSSGSWTNYANPRVDRLIEEADRAVDPNKRAALVKQVMGVLTEDVAAIWVHHFMSKIAVSDNIGGLQNPPTPWDLNNTGVFYHLEKLFMKRPK